MKPIPPKRHSRSEMLPLMDVIFLLLVLFIFMIVRMRPDFGVSVTLPSVQAGPRAEEKTDDELTQVTVSVTADAAVYVNEGQVELDGVIAAIEQKSDNAPHEDIRIILKGDTAADYGRIVEVFYKLRQSGLTKVVFDVDRRSE